MILNGFEADPLEGFDGFVESGDEKEFFGRFLLKCTKSGIKSFVKDIVEGVEELARVIGG